MQHSAQGKKEGGTAIELAFGPDLPAVPPDTPLDHGETDTGPREVGGRVQPLERAEELAHVSHVKPRSVVTNEKSPDPALRGETDLDTSLGALAGKLPGVAKKVLHDDRQQARVAFGRQAVLHDNLDVARRVGFAKPFADASGDVREIDPFLTHLGATKARERK